MHEDSNMYHTGAKAVKENKKNKKLRHVSTFFFLVTNWTVKIPVNELVSIGPWYLLAAV